MEALTKWLGHIPEDVVQDMAQIAPMLARLGYDPYANPPNYGSPDPLVINNTHRVSATEPLACLAPLSLWPDFYKAFPANPPGSGLEKQAFF